jgi:hypothetical protein
MHAKKSTKDGSITRSELIARRPQRALTRRFDLVLIGHRRFSAIDQVKQRSDR